MPNLSLNRLHKRWGVFIHIIFPLCVGGLIYIGWRDTELRMFRWLKQLNIWDDIYVWRSWLVGTSTLPSWVKYSVPDATWMWSLTGFFTYLWQDVPAPQKWIYIWMVVVLGLGTEVAQALGLLSGVFDWMDLGLMSIAAMCSFYFSLAYTKK